MPRLLALSLLALVLSSCTEDQIEAEWSAWLDEHNACESVDDCAMVTPDCPLGCGDGVRTEDLAAAEAKANALIAAWSGGVQNCAYDCLQLELSCTANRCTTTPVEEF